MEQRTAEWYAARLGVITSSQVGCLIGKGKSAPFTTTGISYINQLISERLLPSQYVDDPEQFKAYLSRVDVDNKAMRYGTAMEDIARDWYAHYLDAQTEDVSPFTVVETGFVNHPDIEGWGDSPDALVLKDSEIIGTLEIKCPYNPANTVKFLNALVSAPDKAEALKKVDSDYYWQCVSHCACNGVRWCDFVVYDPMVFGEAWIFNIQPSEEDMATLRGRVLEALDYIEQQTKVIFNP